MCSQNRRHVRSLAPASSLAVSLAAALAVGTLSFAACATASTASTASTAPPAAASNTGTVAGYAGDAPPAPAELTPYGAWMPSPRGAVFVPDVAVGWQPYTLGHWEPTGEGWFWVSDEPFAATYHYGRWLNLDGRWCWLPGTVWAPAWVDWWSGPGYVGWAPLGYRQDVVFVDEEAFFDPSEPVVGHVRHLSASEVRRNGVRHVPSLNDDVAFRERHARKVATSPSPPSSEAPRLRGIGRQTHPKSRAARPVKRAP